MRRVEREKEAWRKMNEPRSNRAAGANPTIQNLKPDGAAGRSGGPSLSSSKPSSKAVITNNKKPTTRISGQQPSASIRANRDEEMKQNVAEVSISGSGGRAGATNTRSSIGRTAMA